MKKSYRRLLVMMCAAAVLTVPAVTSAVEYGGVGARPANPQPGNPRSQAIFIYQLKPGQTVNDGVKVYNNTAQSQTVALGAVDSILASGGAFSCAQNVDAKEDVGAWLQLQSNNVTLAAGDSQVVPFTITVPSTAGVGEHDGCVTIQAQSQTATQRNQSGVVLSFRSAIRVVVTVPGKLVKKLTFSSVKINRDGARYVITPMASNEGNVSLDTALHARLTPLVGAAGQTTGGTYPVLPHSRASWNFEVAHPFWGGLYHAEVTASYNSPPVGAGQNRGPDQTARATSGWFFVAPKPLAALIYLVVLLVLAAAAYGLVRRRSQALRISRDWRPYTVRDGDTVTGLATKYHTSWRKFARVNKLRPPYTLQKGDKLSVPPLKNQKPEPSKTPRKRPSKSAKSGR